MAVPYTFGSATSSIPLSQLDSNFATTITLGNTAIQLGNTVTTLNNMTLANVTITSGTSNLATTAITNGTSNVTIASSGGNISMATNGTTAITIDTSQNVGIGTTSVTAPLQVKVGTNNNFKVKLQGSTLNLSAENDAASAQVALMFNSGAAQIDASGNFGIGTTTTTYIGATFKQAISGGQYLSVMNTTLSAADMIDFVTSSGFAGKISTSGTTTTYSTSSDYRLKENIALMTGALNKVAQLKPVTYKWKATGESTNGFIAHELAEIIPECVVGEKDAVDAEGNPQYQSIDTSFLVATLTAALQETKALLDTQAETINALTARIVALEAK